MKCILSDRRSTNLIHPTPKHARTQPLHGSGT
jgi:hypothetical protein